MIITDTHAHLYSEAFDPDRTEMMNRAIDVGVKRFFLPAIDSSYTGSMLKLQSEYPDSVFLMAGLHPTSVKSDSFEKELKHVEKLLTEHKFYAIGEIGIDLYWDKDTLDIQQLAFKHQINLAKKNNLPIIIHCRDGFEEVFKTLDQLNDDSLYGIFHCFTGSEEDAQHAIDLGFKLGIGGVVTFKNGKIDQFLNKFDVSNIVIETDSPYLSPVPYRGKRNESAYIVKVLEKLSDIYGMSQQKIADITTENSKEIFKV